MIIFHGSEHIIQKPLYEVKNKYNDFGVGFYCTQDIELAKEWACSENNDGYVNIYDIDLTGLTILDLSDSNYTILHWLTILIQNRVFRTAGAIAVAAKKYLTDNFNVDINAYDIIIGYRADNSNFSYAKDFLNNTTSVNKLAASVKSEKQFVLKSEKAFDQLHFIGTGSIPKDKYFKLKMSRDRDSRVKYLNSQEEYNPTDLFISGIIQQEIKSDDPRIHKL